MELEFSPYLAPLSLPMIEQAANLQHISLSPLTKELESHWLELIDTFKRVRTRVYDIMQPAVEQESVSSAWLIQQLAEYSPRKTSSETISRWRENGLLTYQAHNAPSPDSAAALLSLRILAGPKKIAKWTPKTINRQEPNWWCWRQDSPSDPIIIQAVPLPIDIPASALLWTQWRGAAWQPEWLPVGTLGAARWAGTRREKNTLIWDITEKDIKKWDSAVSPLGEGIIKNAPLTLHTLATLALLRAATTRLEETTNTLKNPFAENIYFPDNIY